jgi:ribosomal protein S18 acetylase RimI-like enzyme
MAKWRRVRVLKRSVYERSRAFWYEKDLREGWGTPNMGLPVRIDLHDTAGTLNWLKSFSESWMYNEKEIEVGLAEKHYFANAKLDGRIIGYTKIGTKRVYIYDFDRYLPLPDDVSFLYHVYVAKEFRKNNIAQALITTVMSDLVPKGYRKMFCHIAEWNAPSIRLFESLGFRRVADIRFHRFFKMLKVWASRIPQDHPPKISLSMPDLLR